MGFRTYCFGNTGEGEPVASTLAVDCDAAWPIIEDGLLLIDAVVWTVGV
jgi:hypothetical protein